MTSTESLRLQIDLSGPWLLTWSTPAKKIHSLRDLQSEGIEWTPATVPGEVHFDVLGEEKAERLFNSYLVVGSHSEIFDKAFVDEHKWIAETDFWYRKTFDLDLETLSDDVELIFEGIDCFAAIWLNGQEIGETHNALASHSFKIAPQLLRSRDNELVVRIESTKNRILADNPDAKLDYERYVSGQHVGEYLAQYVRKPAGSMRYLTFKEGFLTPAGIWREVRLVSYPKARIDDVWVKTRILDLDGHRIAKAELEIEIALAGRTDTEGLTLDVALLDKESKSVFEATAKAEQTTVTLKKALEEIRPWYPHNVGEPYLYTLRVALLNDRGLVDRCEHTVGFRNVELVLEEDGENRFYFRINNERVVLKGALLTLMDYFLFRETESKYREVLEKMAKANMNMVCPLGAEAYYKPAFYDICDRLGIMVLGTLPFVWGGQSKICRRAVHPQVELRQEVEKHVKAVRNHPSVVCFFGGCECYGYNPVNWRVIRDACRNLCPQTPYVPSHPWSPAGTLTKEDVDWIRENHGLEYYCGHDPDFNPTVLEWISPASGVTEGFADTSLMCLSGSNAVSLPTLKTVRETCSKDKAQELMQRFLAGKHLVFPGEKILPPFKNDRLDLVKLEDVILFSHLTDAHRVRTDIEYFRRRKECGGGGFCAFNPFAPDIWHGAVDYYLRPRASYYFARRAYENLMIMVYGKPLPGTLNFHGGWHFSSFLVHGEPHKEVWIVNDYRKELGGKLTVAQYSFTGEQRWKEEREVTVPPASTTKVYEFVRDERMLARRKTDFVLTRFVSDGGLEASNTYFIGELRELDFPEAKLDVRKSELKRDSGRLCLALNISADKYTSIVRVTRVDGDTDDLDISGNYFEICPNETVRVEVKMARPGSLWVEALNCERVCV